MGGREGGGGRGGVTRNGLGLCGAKGVENRPGDSRERHVGACMGGWGAGWGYEEWGGRRYGQGGWGVGGGGKIWGSGLRGRWWTQIEKGVFSTTRGTDTNAMVVPAWGRGGWGRGRIRVIGWAQMGEVLLSTIRETDANTT